MRKLSLLLILLIFLMVGCSSEKLFDAHTSYFDHYSADLSDSAYTVTGTVYQEDDGNTVLVKIHAKKDVTVTVKGTVKRESGADTHLTYVAPDGTKTAISDSSSEDLDSKIKVLAGDSTVKFLGNTAVYDFELHFGVADGVSYSGKI